MTSDRIHVTREANAITQTNDGSNIDTNTNISWRTTNASQESTTNSLWSRRGLSMRCQTLWSELCWAEISGSLGDLGTFLPLLIALSVSGSVNFAPALFWAGFLNVLTGFLWDSPMPVQPMKTIAAVAIAEGMSAGEVMGAGLGTGIVITFLGVTGLIDQVAWLVPSSVVRGLQVGLGFSMARSGISSITDRPWDGHVDTASLGIACALFTLFALRYKGGTKLPAALLLSLLGFIVAIVTLAQDGEVIAEPAFPVVWTGDEVNGTVLVTGFVRAGIAQIPLTVLNSVVSVCELSNSLFPTKPVSRRSVASSVGLMNLVCLWFGAMPMCHGAGGLAGQYRFGARGGASVVFLGIVKVLCASIFGFRSGELLAKFPESVLGVLLLFAGLGLAVNGAKRRQHTDDSVEVTMTIMATAVATLSLKTLGGCATGVVVGIFHGQFDHVIEVIKQHRHYARFCCHSNKKSTSDDSDDEDDGHTGVENVSSRDNAEHKSGNINNTLCRKCNAVRTPRSVECRCGAGAVSGAEDESTAADDDTNMNLAVAGV